MPTIWVRGNRLKQPANYILIAQKGRTTSKLDSIVFTQIFETIIAILSSNITTLDYTKNFKFCKYLCRNYIPLKSNNVSILSGSFKRNLSLKTRMSRQSCYNKIPLSSNFDFCQSLPLRWTQIPESLKWKNSTESKRFHVLWVMGKRQNWVYGCETMQY